MTVLAKKPIVSKGLSALRSTSSVNISLNVTGSSREAPATCPFLTIAHTLPKEPRIENINPFRGRPAQIGLERGFSASRDLGYHQRPFGTWNSGRRSMALQHALVVDDSRSARKVLQRMLEKEKLSADSVESAEEAFEYLKTRRPDVIFMDHMMPGMDGLSATLAIQRNPETSGIPTFMYTSKEGPEYVEEATSHGALGVLPKPATGVALQKVLNDLRSLAAAKEPAPEPAAPQSSMPTTAASLEQGAVPQVHLREIELIVKQHCQKATESLRQEMQAELRQSLAELRKEMQLQSDDLRQVLEAKTQTLSAQLEEKTQPSALLAAVRTTVHKLAVHASQKTIVDKLAPVEDKIERQLQQRIQELKVPISEVETQVQLAAQSAKQSTLIAYAGVAVAIVAILLVFFI
jgi:CheY-like chemotaxis protein